MGMRRKVGQFLSFKYTKPDWNIYPSTLAADSLKGAVSEMDLSLFFSFLGTKTGGRVRSVRPRARFYLRLQNLPK